MATTSESIIDGLRWCGRVLTVALRRAIVLGVVVALFAAAVIYTTRERVSDCAEVTATQRAALESLRTPDPGRSFDAVGSAVCDDGVFGVGLAGIARSMEPATAQLVADGWILEAEFLPFFDQLWRRCFVLDRSGWEQIEIAIEARRDGMVQTAEAAAPEGLDGCELDRRDVSTIYPPRDRGTP